MELDDSALLTEPNFLVRAAKPAWLRHQLKLSSLVSRAQVFPKTCSDWVRRLKAPDPFLAIPASGDDDARARSKSGQQAVQRFLLEGNATFRRR